MRLRIFKVKKAPGFRLSLADILFLVLLGTLSFLAREYFSAYSLYLVPAYLGASFFLFCNVFRIGDGLELIWYGSFLCLSLVLLWRPEYYWLLVLGICEPLKLGLIIHRVGSGDYVGVYSSRISGR
jgi:hypothetical protein